MAEYTLNLTGSEIDARLAKIPQLQDKLVSGTNIKTINNKSILGPGNIEIQGGGDIDASAVCYLGDVIETV